MFRKGERTAANDNSGVAGGEAAASIASSIASAAAAADSGAGGALGLDVKLGNIRVVVSGLGIDELGQPSLPVTACTMV